MYEEEFGEEYTMPLEGISVIIERFDGEEAYIIRSNQKGEFQFTDLRPGSWKIRLDNRQLPKFYRLENDEISCDLAPRDHKEVIFKLKPIPRKMQKITTVKSA